MVRYLLVDDSDGRVLAELASPQQAARVLAAHARNPNGSPTVTVVRIDHQQGDWTDIHSMVSVRVLPPLTTRRAETDGAPDRPSRHAHGVER